MSAHFSDFYNHLGIDRYQYLQILGTIITLVPPLLQEILESFLSSLGNLVSYMARLHSVSSNIHGSLCKYLDINI